MKNKTWTHPSLTEGRINGIPLMYKSAAGDPSIQRLRAMNIKSSSPYIAEYLKDVVQFSQQLFYFQNTYKRPPLVLGQVKLASTGKIIKLENLTVTNNTVRWAGARGDQFLFRIYNLAFE